jgi:hypothetical protein
MLSALLTCSDLLTGGTLDSLIDWLFLLIGSFGSGIQVVYEREELISLRKAVLFLYFNGMTFSYLLIQSNIDIMESKGPKIFSIKSRFPLNRGSLY